MVRQAPLPDLVIVTTISHKLSQPARSERVVDSEATPGCAARRPAEPRVFLFGTMLPAPEVHEAAVRQTREPRARLETVRLGVHAGHAGVEVSQHQEWRMAAASHPLSRRIPERGYQGPFGRSIDSCDTPARRHELYLEPPARIQARVPGQRLASPPDREPREQAKTPLLGAAWRAEPVLVAGFDKLVAQVRPTGRDGLLEHEDIRVALQQPSRDRPTPPAAPARMFHDTRRIIPPAANEERPTSSSPRQPTHTARLQIRCA